MPNQTDRQPQTLAERITERLDQLGMSRRELSRRTGLSRQTIHNIEREGFTNLKPTTFTALDSALKWEPGTAFATAMGRGDSRSIEERLTEYLQRIAIHLSHMNAVELELTCIMLEENQLGTSGHSLAEFSEQVNALVTGYMADLMRLKKASRPKNAS